MWFILCPLILLASIWLCLLLCHLAAAVGGFVWGMVTTYLWARRTRRQAEADYQAVKRGLAEWEQQWTRWNKVFKERMREVEQNRMLHEAQRIANEYDPDEDE